MNSKSIEEADVVVKNGEWTEQFAPRLLIGLMFLLPVFFLPFGSFLFDAGKVILLALAALSTLSLWIIERLRERKVTITFNWVLTGLIAIAFVFIVSALFSAHRNVGLMGSGFALTTASTITLLTILACMVSIFFREKNRILYAYSALILSALVIAFFHILRFPFIFGPGALSFGLFTSTVSNTIGSWNDLGIFFGLISLLSLMGLEMLRLSRAFKIVLTSALCVSLLFLILVNYILIWYVLGVSALLFFVVSLMQGNSSKDAEMDGRRDRGPSFIALGIMILCFIFIIANNPIKNIVSPIFGISFIEARPGISSTMTLFTTVIKENPIFGAGPNQFREVWLLNKPAAINQTAFWDTDFATAVGFVPTAIIMTGILGLLAWLFFLGSFIYHGFTSIFNRGGGSSQFFTISTFFAAAYLWAFSIFYVPGFVVLILAFFFTGLFATNLKDAYFFRKAVSFRSSARMSGVFILVSTLVLMTVAGWAYLYGRNFVSAVYFASANYDASVKQDFEGSEQKAISAIGLNPTDDYYRFVVLLELVRLQTLAAEGGQGLTPEALQAQLQIILSNALTAGNAAVAYNNSNYLNSLALGQVYEWIIPLKVFETAYDNAAALYLKAHEQNPNSPVVLLFLSRLEATKGNYEKATEYINKALTAKSDYLDAVFLLAQIQVAQGNSAGAIRSVQAAAAATPENPTLWFQIGMLRYSTKDFAGAASSYEQALALAPDYANAKYFLGLSYEQTGELTKAIALFDDLQKNNPDNQEVALILSNLRSGKPSFADAKPPIDDEPEKRKELPLKEKEPTTTVEADEEDTTN